MFLVRTRDVSMTLPVATGPALVYIRYTFQDILLYLSLTEQ